MKVKKEKVQKRVSDPFYFDADLDPRIRIEKYGSGFVSPQILKLKYCDNFFHVNFFSNVFSSELLKFIYFYLNFFP